MLLADDPQERISRRGLHNNTYPYAQYTRILIHIARPWREECYAIRSPKAIKLTSEVPRDWGQHFSLGTVRKRLVI